MGATQVSDGGGHERRQGTGKGGQAEPKGCAACILDRGLGTAERRKHTLYVRLQDRACTRRPQGTLRAVDQRRSRLALERRELL
jgi:hypothetical protein